LKRVCVDLNYKIVYYYFINARNIMDKEIFLVPYAHLDTQWRWEYPTTIKKYIKSTMTKNFKLFKKYPHYVFNFTGATRYSMMKEYYPEQFAKVKESEQSSLEKQLKSAGFSKYVVRLEK